MGHVQNEPDNLFDDDDDEQSPLLGSRLGRALEGQESNGSIPRTKYLVDIDQFDKSRWRSIRVMYLSVFLGAITFTITMSSLWPFLQVLDPSTKSSFLGWVVASYSVGQLVASPLFGAWANYRQSSKEPLTVSLVMMVLSNLFYTYLQSMPNHKNFYMILARGLIGFSAGNVAVIRSYMSGATTVHERTSAMANLSMCQAMGFILGPVLQSILVLVKYPGPAESTVFHFNMYTAPAFLAASVALFNLVLFLIIFKEYRVNDGGDVNANNNKPPQQQPPAASTEESVEKSMDAMCHSNNHDSKEYKLDYLAVFSSIYLFFVVLFMFTVFETIGTPLTMHMYAWNKSTATFYQGIFLGVGGLLSVGVFGGTKYLAKKYNERYLLLIGFIFCLGGYFSFIPWGHHLPPRGMAPIRNNSHPTSSEAIFYMVSDLLYYHKHGFGGDKSKTNVFPLPAHVTKAEFIEKERLRSNTSLPTSLRYKYVTASIISSSFSQESSNLTSYYKPNNSGRNHYQVDKGNKSAPKKGFTETTTTTTTPTTTPTTTSTPTAPETTKPITTTTTTTTPTTTTTTTTSITTTPTTTTTSTPTTTTTATTTSITTTTPTTTTTSTPTTTTTATTTSITTTTPTTTTTSTPTTTTATTTTATTTTTPRSRTSTTQTPATTKRTTSPHHHPNTTGLTPSNHTYAPEGCPWEYDWCAHVPMITLGQYIFASFVVTVGYPMCNMLTYTIYSKVLGPKPQGLWMGWLTASGSLARTVGPIYVSQIYDSYGPQITYGSITCFVFVTILFYLIVFRRLTPFSYTNNPRRPLLFWRKRNRRLL